MMIMIGQSGLQCTGWKMMDEWDDNDDDNYRYGNRNGYGQGYGYAPNGYAPQYSFWWLLLIARCYASGTVLFYARTLFFNSINTNPAILDGGRI
jgi:hypothetical protein